MDLLASFKTKAEAVSAEVHHFGTRAQALDFIGGLLHKEGVADAPGSYAVWAASPFLNGLGKAQLSQSIPGLQFEVTREVAAAAKVGISQFDWAIANTGTLAQEAAPVEQRLVSTLPLVHIALIASDRLVPDLPAFLTKMNPKNTKYIALVTGASRTADIERVLTIGVHGPERFVIIFVDELGGVQ